MASNDTSKVLTSNDSKTAKPKKPDPNCEMCSGEGYITEHESFQNAWGEHGLDSWDCPCAIRKKSGRRPIAPDDATGAK